MDQTPRAHAHEAPLPRVAYGRLDYLCAGRDRDYRTADCQKDYEPQRTANYANPRSFVRCNLPRNSGGACAWTWGRHSTRFVSEDNCESGVAAPFSTPCLLHLSLPLSGADH